MCAPRAGKTKSSLPAFLVDSCLSPIHGERKGCAYNGYFASVCYHPLFLFNHYLDSYAMKQRPGNLRSDIQILAKGRHSGTIRYK
jgi:hypothetical protein